MSTKSISNTRPSLLPEPSLFDDPEAGAIDAESQQPKSTINGIPDGEPLMSPLISSHSVTPAIARNTGKMTEMIRLRELHQHPGNPRLAPRADVVEQIAAQLNGKLDEAHALIVRPNGSGYEIISGHHRKLAAEKAGLTEVPCWVREMSDEDAYMALALNNAQGELHPLEVGLHALRSGLSVREYAAKAGSVHRTLLNWTNAAAVSVKCADIGAQAKEVTSQLTEIHAAPRWLWHALVAVMLDKGWSVEQTRAAVKRVKDTPEPPAWADALTIADKIVEGAMRPDAVAKFQATLNAAKDRLTAEGLAAELDAEVAKAKPALISELTVLCKVAIDKQAEHDKAARDKEIAEQRTQEEAAARASRLRNYVSLEEWKTLDEKTREELLFQKGAGPSLNKQDTADIEWAQWSWNPITGCLHDCPYCYARDIANQKRMEKVYPNGFEPTLRPHHLLAPHSQKPPTEAATDARFKNVFTGSMADIFGRWVPEEWIKAVLTQMRAAPQWNFLCLTKFPKRMSEFDIPPNTWMGTTVDLQARVAAAETGFAKVRAAVKWLSVEPMLEPLTFSRLDLFDWIVIGGASASTKTPEWHPPSEWIHDLKNQARAAGVAIYEKSNLWHQTTPRTLELPGGLPVTPDRSGLPEQFNYLGRAKTADQKAEAA